jgi:DNA polymerase elongation subunit (family B)
MSYNFYTNVYTKGNKIYVRGYNDKGPFNNVVEYKPYLFLVSSKETRTEYHTLDGKPVVKKMFESINAARKFVDTCEGITNMEVYGFTNFQYMYIYDNFPGEIKYDPSLINIIGIDIETQSDDGFPDIATANKEVTAITISRRGGEKIVFGLFSYKPKSEKITFIQCDDEYDLLEKFLHIWQSGRWMPDVVTGWNIEFFDIPYLVNRITNILGTNEAKKLSPWKILEERTVEVRGKENQVFIPAGINVLDYYALYRKFSFGNEESYKLDHIAEKVLGQKKLDYSAYGSLHELYVKNYELFIDYNIHDVTLVDMLEEKLKFIDQVMTFAYDAKVNYADTFTTVRPWDVIIHNYLLDRACVIPQFKKSNDERSLVGGYVKEPKLGMSKWVVSFDLNSLYPHLIMGYNISPETLKGSLINDGWPNIHDLLKGNLSDLNPKYAYAANGTYYQKDKQGFLPALMEKMYNDRVEYKNKMIEAKQNFIVIEAEMKKRGMKVS